MDYCSFNTNKKKAAKARITAVGNISEPNFWNQFFSSLFNLTSSSRLVVQRTWWAPPYPVLP